MTRYTIHATSTQPTVLVTREIAEKIPVIGGAETMGEALAMVKAAYENHAAYACTIDTRPGEPDPVTEAERAALGAIAPKMARNTEAEQSGKPAPIMRDPMQVP